MNNIALIIVTAFINLAVSNFLFLRYQKKIESTFIKSVFEYQTKFTRNHEKTVETLETIYQKFQELQVKVNRNIMNIIVSSENDLPDDEHRNELKAVFEKADNLQEYYFARRIYLEEKTSEQIGQIVNKTKLLNLSIHMALIIFDAPDKEMPKMISALKISAENWGDIKIDEASFDAKEYLYEVMALLNSYSATLEHYYRDAVNT